MRILQINREIKAPSGVLAGGGWGACTSSKFTMD